MSYFGIRISKNGMNAYISRYNASYKCVLLRLIFSVLTDKRISQNVQTYEEGIGIRDKKQDAANHQIGINQAIRSTMPRRQ